MAGFPFGYAVTPAEAQVRLGPWVVRRVVLSDIDRAEARPLSRVPLANERWTNLWPLGAYLVLHRRRGWFPNVVINPSDPQAFLDALRREAPHLAGRPPGS